MRNVHSAQHIRAPIICIFFSRFLFFIAHNKTSPDTTKTVNLLLVCGLSAQTGELLSRPHVYFREKQQAAASRLRGGANVATQWQIPTSPLDRDQQAKHLGDFFPSGGRNYCSVAFHIFIGTPAFLLSLASCPPFPLVPGSWGSQSIQGFCHFKPPPVFLASFPALSGQQLAVSEYSRPAQVSLWVRS